MVLCDIVRIFLLRYMSTPTVYYQKVCKKIKISNLWLIGLLLLLRLLGGPAEAPWIWRLVCNINRFLRLSNLILCGHKNYSSYVSSIGSTETKYIKLKSIFLLLFFKFSTHFLLFKNWASRKCVLNLKNNNNNLGFSFMYLVSVTV